LLLGVAAQQLWLARTAHLNAWSGGGFGMFATTDVWARRHLHAFAIGPGFRRELEVPGTLRSLHRRALALPTGTRLRALAVGLLAETDFAGEPVDAVSVTVYGVRFDPGTIAPEGERLGGIELRADER
jgi:hypothetical protein